MLIRKFYIADTCLCGEAMATYFLWTIDHKITLRVKMPDELRLIEIFNAEPEPDPYRGEIKFSCFKIPGYLGLTFGAQVEGTAPTNVMIEIVIEDECGLIEEYEKSVTLLPVTGNRHFLLPTICNHQISAGNYQSPEVSEISPARRDKEYTGSPDEKTAVYVVFDKIFQKTDRILADLEDEFRIEGRALTLLCSEHKMKYDQIVIPKKTWPLPKTVKFTSVVPSRVEVTRLPDLTPVPESVVYTDDGYKLKLNFLTEGDQYLLSFEYDFPETLCLSSLISLGCSPKIPETLNDLTIICGISAQLKYPEILARGGCALNIRDLEVCIDLPFKPGLSEPDRANVLDSGIGFTGCIPVAAPIHEVIPESDLSNNIVIKKDFTFHSAEWAFRQPANSNDTPRPAVIKLVVRTDLSLGKPATDGVLSLRYRDRF